MGTSSTMFYWVFLLAFCLNKLQIIYTNRLGDRFANILLFFNREKLFTKIFFKRGFRISLKNNAYLLMLVTFAFHLVLG